MVNGRPVDAPYMHCRPGDAVEAWYPEEESAVTAEADVPLHILYEDHVLLAIDKPAGQLSHPARNEQHGTVANAVAARFRGASGAPEPVRLVHRLDRDTSGVLLFARTAAAARALARQRTSGQMVREYLALVHGRPPATGELVHPLGPDPTHRTRRIVLVREAEGGERVLRFDQAGEAVKLGAEAMEDGLEAHQERRDRQTGKGSGEPATGHFQEARTTYQVIQYGEAASLIAARLHTGRTHQLRAHMASMGHPLLGDALYGGPRWPGLARQALHAWRLRLRHPDSGEDVRIVSPVAADMRDAVRLSIGLE
jgi:23S rRNA pseudouridine1911/1915/1917 synthase